MPMETTQEASPGRSKIPDIGKRTIGGLAGGDAMGPLRGLGVVVLLMLGASGCAGVQARPAWFDQSQGQASQLKPADGLLSRWWSKPAPAPTHAPGESPLPTEATASRSATPEKAIWPEGHQARLLRVFPLLGRRDDSRSS